MTCEYIAGGRGTEGTGETRHEGWVRLSYAGREGSGGRPLCQCLMRKGAEGRQMKIQRIRTKVRIKSVAERVRKSRQSQTVQKERDPGSPGHGGHLGAGGIANIYCLRRLRRCPHTHRLSHPPMTHKPKFATTITHSSYRYEIVI